jgi:hypothetical protein
VTYQECRFKDDKDCGVCLGKCTVLQKEEDKTILEMGKGELERKPFNVHMQAKRIFTS